MCEADTCTCLSTFLNTCEVCGGTLYNHEPINTHSSPTVIPGSTASTETKKATDKKQQQQQNLNQTMPCTEDGEQKSEVASTETKKATDKKQKQNLNQTMPCTADGEQKSEAVKGERELSSTMDY